MGIEKSGKIEEGTKVEKMPGRAWGKGEEIYQEKHFIILFFGLRIPCLSDGQKSIPLMI
jgi:hypothetical protein